MSTINDNSILKSTHNYSVKS